jgi:hypothetical protein
MLNELPTSAFEVLNLPAQQLMRVATEAHWQVLKELHSNTLCVFSSMDTARRFAPQAPDEQFELCLGADVLTQLLSNAERIHGIALDPPSVNDVTPCFTQVQCCER